MEHSPEFERIKEGYENKTIGFNMLRKYVKYGKITPEEFEEIAGVPYAEPN